MRIARVEDGSSSHCMSANGSVLKSAIFLSLGGVTGFSGSLKISLSEDRRLKDTQNLRCEDRRLKTC